MRACAALCLSTALMVTGCGARGDAGATHVERKDGRMYVLAPSDLGRGYRVGDDSGCGQVSPEESSEEFAKFVLDTRPSGCVNEINYIWGGARAKVVPRAVSSAVAIFDDESDARRGMEVRKELIDFMVPASSRGFVELPEFGHDAVSFRDGGYDVPPGAGVFWRNGNLLAVAFAGGPGMTSDEAAEAALELARMQQDRIEHPRTSPPETDDDVELPLDDPTLDVPVWWLGRSFEPGGGLPALRFARAHAGAGEAELGFSMEMDYGASSRETYGVKLWVFHPDAFEKFKHGVLAGLVAGVPCASATKLEIPEGHAVIWAGFAKPTREPCPKRPPDRYVAYVYLKGAVVTVNQPWCIYPCSAPLTGTPDPYNSQRGVAVIAKGLRVREPRSD